MIAEAAAGAGKLGLIATFGPTLESMPPEFPPGVELELALAEGALEALNRRRRRAARRADRRPGPGACASAAARASRWRSSAWRAPAAACEAASGLPVLTTVDSAVRALRSGA